MSHLTDKQFEAILQGQTADPKHLQQCEHCAARLAEKKALASRLRSAFEPVQASDELSEQIAKRLALKAQCPASLHQTKQSSVLRSYWRYWAATAAVLVTIPLLMMLSSPSQAMAAKAELLKIHTHNLDPTHAFFSESDPQKLANYFKRTLGFNPLMPPARQGLALRGCCVNHFRGRQTGSYVVDTPDGVMSIIVVRETLGDLGMNERFEKKDYTFGRTTFADNNMVSVRIGHYTYCAVGEVSSEYLTDLLEQLVTDIEE